jgi:hypothetical protein
VRVGVDLAIAKSGVSPSSRGEEPMARRTFNVVDITEILVHWYAGRSQNEIAASLGVDRKTIRQIHGARGGGGWTTGRGGGGRRVGAHVVPRAGRDAAAAGRYCARRGHTRASRCRRPGRTVRPGRTIQLHELTLKVDPRAFG